jgi:DNA polymerase III subunit gamma/tau
MAFKIKARGEGDLKTRYRPQRLSEICPTFPVKEAKNILTDPNASQVYLFEGLTGCGKTTLARIIARATVCSSTEAEKPCLQCTPCKAMESSNDYMEINGADVRGIEAMRAITPGFRQYGGQLQPGKGTKIYIFDEAQQITPAAQELLNKVLEEPPEHIKIFLCTTNKKGLKRTLLGRCNKINFRRVTRSQANSLIEQVMADVGKELPEESVLDDLFMRAEGSVRDLLNLLDKVVLGTYNVGSDDSGEALSTGSPDIRKLVAGYINKDWDAVRKILQTENVKGDPDGYRETVCTFLSRDALKFKDLKMKIAAALGHLGGSMWNEPKREQYNLLVLRSMRCCYEKLSR